MQVNKEKLKKEWKNAVIQSKKEPNNDLWIGYSWALKEVMDGLFSDNGEDKEDDAVVS